MNRQLAESLRIQAADLLRPFAEENNLALAPGTARYEKGVSLTLKFEFKTRNDDGVPADFAQKAATINLPADCYGKQFRSNGTTFAVSDIVLRRRKYPVSARALNTDKIYKFSADFVKFKLLVGDSNV